jgi:uncharacterized protein (DUF305 family)
VKEFMKARELSAEIQDLAKSIGQTLRDEIESMDQHAAGWEAVGL